MRYSEINAINSPIKPIVRIVTPGCAKLPDVYEPSTLNTRVTIAQGRPKERSYGGSIGKCVTSNSG